MKKTITLFSGGFLTIFGAISLFMTLSIFFDLFGIREKEGNYLLSVVWANFFCAILYLVAAYGFFTNRQTIHKWLGWALFILIIAYIFLIIHIFQGGIYEKKTVVAMGFRTSLTFLFYLIARKINKIKTA